MKKSLIILIVVLTIVGFTTHPIRAQIVSISEASTVAKNWISLIIAERGSWGDDSIAEAEPLLPLYRGDKMIGYYCQVKPKGFIVISLLKGLAPVKAYSAYSYFDPLSEESVAHLVKEKMVLILDTIEKQLGPIETIGKQSLLGILEVDNSDAWFNLLNEVPAKNIKVEVPGDSTKNNYQEGDIMLLGNNWHQWPPFNDDCPYMGCPLTSNGKAFVGCVATAGAQIMDHWHWPPFGNNSPYNDPYDWPNMLDVVTNSSPQVNIDAVAELGYEVALAVNMNFGCDGSGAVMTDMEGVFQINYMYSNDCNPEWRQFYTPYSWFEMLKAQFNLNRPVEYGIIGHAIVGDGWQEVGSPVLKQYHMNWGWTATSNDTWYTLDELPDGGTDIEHVLRDIIPYVALGNTVSGTYSKMAFPYRYFDRDSYGASATFNAGQYIQFLENVEVIGTGTSSYLRFDGTITNNTRLFTSGNPAQGILIRDGAVRLKNNGSIKLQ
jgi:hypothetical protein